MALRPITKGFLIGSIVLVVFYLVILGGFFIISGDRLAISGDSVGVVEVKGLIRESQPILEQLLDYRDDSSISAIIVRIDSPGGAVGPSQEIYREVLRTSKFKPVIASLGGTCASGGYYIASACSHIVANPGTLTGSIGVVMEFFNVQGLFEWVGLRSITVKSGEFKDIGSYARKMAPRERKILQEVVDDVHEQFIEAVSIGRNLPTEDVRQLADGRLFTGKQAKELALVDQLGNFQDAVMIAAELVGIKGEPKVYWPKVRKSKYWELFFDNFESRLFNAIFDKVVEKESSLMYR